MPLSIPDEPKKEPPIEIEFVTAEEMSLIKRLSRDAAEFGRVLSLREINDVLTEYRQSVTSARANTPTSVVSDDELNAAANKAAELNRTEPVEMTQHPESRESDDEIVNEFFDRIMQAEFADGHLDRAMRVGLAVNDAPRTKAQEDEIARRNALQKGTLGPNTEGQYWGKRFGLEESARGTTKLGRQGGTSYLDKDGDVVTMWGYSKQGQVVSFVIGVNGQQVLIPVNVFEAMVGRVASYFNNGSKDVNPDEHEW